jgi:hypothetical protein
MDDDGRCWRGRGFGSGSQKFFWGIIFPPPMPPIESCDQLGVRERDTSMGEGTALTRGTNHGIICQERCFLSS